MGLFISLSFQACEDEDPLDPDQDFSTSEDYAIASQLFGGVKDAADDAESGGDNIGGRMAGCATISLDTPTANQYSIIVDFGAVNCIGKDSRARRGKLIIGYNGLYRDSGTVITHTFDNFFVDEHQILGTKTVENKGKNSAGQPYFEINVAGQVVKPNLDTISFTSVRQRTWVAGDTTLGFFGWLDDRYEITGNGAGVSGNGTTFTFSITNPLIVQMPCPYITEGTFSLVPQGGSPRVVDYGDGTCDRKARLIFLGRTYNITI